MDKKTKGILFKSGQTVNNNKSQSGGQKKKLRLKIPWKKCSFAECDNSEQLDNFIKEVIEKAKAEYLRECELQETCNGTEDNRACGLPVLEIEDVYLTDDEKDSDCCEQVSEEQTTNQDQRLPTESGQENKPLLNQSPSDQTIENGRKRRSIGQTILSILTCNCCGCCCLCPKYEVT